MALVAAGKLANLGPLAFFGYLILGIGPGIVFFAFFIAPKSFLTLVALLSAFVWLSVLLFTSAIFRGFLPLPEQTASYAGLLIASVFIQELMRYVVWRMHKKTLETLDKMARVTNHRFSLLDKLYMALAWGFGHGSCHAIFFFMSMLPLTTGSGTYYQDACPQMSMFLIGALYSIAFGMILTSVMVLALDGYATRNYAHIVTAGLLHAGAALLTLGNMNRNGCIYVMPILLGSGMLCVVYVASMCWRRALACRPSLDDR